MLTKKDLKKLAELSRMDLNPGEEDKLIKDLKSILDYFEELKAVPTEGAAPTTGGTDFRNVFREDEAGNGLPGEAAKKAFPEKERGYLKVPPVFDDQTD